MSIVSSPGTINSKKERGKGEWLAWATKESLANSKLFDRLRWGKRRGRKHCRWISCSCYSKKKRVLIHTLKQTEARFTSDKISLSSKVACSVARLVFLIFHLNQMIFLCKYCSLANNESHQIFDFFVNRLFWIRANFFVTFLQHINLMVLKTLSKGFKIW